MDQIRLPGMCVCFGWDKDGDLLAAITDKSSNLLVWDANTRRSQWIDSGIRDPLNVLIWSKSGPNLAIGSYRGNLMLYNHRTSRKVPVLGKHSKAITCGAWSESSLLALGSEDRTLSISNNEGDTIRVATLRAEPSDLQFSEMKQDEKTTFPGGGKENTVSAIVGGKTLYLFNLYDPDNPIELAFQSRYGTIMAYHWFGDGYILLGFSAGFFVVISTHMKEIGQELFQVFRNDLVCFFSFQLIYQQCVREMGICQLSAKMLEFFRDTFLPPLSLDRNMFALRILRWRCF